MFGPTGQIRFHHATVIMELHSMPCWPDRFVVEIDHASIVSRNPSVARFIDWMELQSVAFKITSFKTPSGNTQQFQFERIKQAPVKCHSPQDLYLFHMHKEYPS